MTEADTCRKFVVPLLQKAGWDNDPHSIAEQCYFTAGRIVAQCQTARRRPGKRADYLLRYTRDLPLAVAEAKAAYRHPADGLQQAKEYATILSLGGEEEKGIQGNFPEDKQTAETALLFLQLIMRKLRRVTGGGNRTDRTDAAKAARAAVVVPNGTLFGDGVCARIKEELLKDFNLHTIVRLPNGVFAPYTSIPTNILFFDRSGPAKHVWYYEQPLPEGRKNYTKTAPIQFEEFAPLVAWWGKRAETDRAWRVPAAELLANNCNLDRKNPRAKEDITHLPPEQLAASILQKEQRIGEIMANIQKLLSK
jgi:type I restriction-modification system DNA methylase subunit